MISSDLQQIVTQATSVSERLSNGLFKADTAQINEQQVISDRLNHWCKVVAKGNWENFHKRLLWNGWDIDRVRLCLGTFPVFDSQALPSWAGTLSEIVQTASEFALQDEFPGKLPQPKRTSGGLESPLPINPEKPLPFEDLWLPAVVVARQKLLSSLGAGSLSTDNLPLELLCESAYLSLERSLLKQLLHLSAKTLAYEFSQNRFLGRNLLDLPDPERKGNKSKVHYSAFVQKLLQDGLLTFFQKYPVLGRLIATAIDFWVEATAEFLQRLAADLSELGSREWGTNKVTEINPYLSDPHARGRSVIALTFESGLKLIYKPKNLGLEVAYNQFLDWCNQHGVPLPFKVLKVLARDTYGWMEYVEHLPCEDAAAAGRFYQRAGMLLCLLYVLGATDCHQQNLIASGEHLVLIDMETLMQHEANLMASPEAIEAEMNTVEQQFWDSVLRTELLPRWEFEQDKQGNRIAYDVSGLGSVDSQQATERVPRWQSVNTDDMHLGYEDVTLPVSANVPMLHGMALSPNDYLEEFVTGFEQMYRFLIEQRSALLADDSPFQALQAQEVRFIFRDTEVYNVILQHTQTPEFLRDGVDWSIELDLLSRAFLWTESKPKAWPILQAELRAMEQLDLPFFAAQSGSDALTVGLESPIEQYFKQPSYNQVLTNLQRLDATDLALQVAIIQGAFYAKVARPPVTENESAPNGITGQTVDLSQISPLTLEQLVEQASRIAQEIQSRALISADGCLNWIGLSSLTHAEHFQLRPLDDSLYDGKCGIALFLAALERVTGRTEFHDTALKALQPLREFLQTADAESSQTFAKNSGIGGALGLGSIIYSLFRISQFLEDSALLEDAQHFANLITPEVIAADQQFDIIGGAAGAMLGLLALYRQTSESGVLEKAVACGQHLLNARVSVDNEFRVWKTLDAHKPLTGFSHGAAGIAYALLRLYAVTQDSAYLDAASEAIAYERSVFSGAAVTCCHGAPGIGLGRLGGWSILATDDIRTDIEVALQTTQKYGVQGVDHLCCGNLGRSEVLLVAAQKLSDPQLLQLAQKQAAWAVARAAQTGGYQLFGNLPSSVFVPGFFQGTAGIGYELLRLAYPDLLPSVLLWE